MKKNIIGHEVLGGARTSSALNGYSVDYYAISALAVYFDITWCFTCALLLFAFIVFFLFFQGICLYTVDDHTEQRFEMVFCAPTTEKIGSKFNMYNCEINAANPPNRTRKGENFERGNISALPLMRTNLSGVVDDDHEKQLPNRK